MRVVDIAVVSLGGKRPHVSAGPSYLFRTCVRFLYQDVVSHARTNSLHGAKRQLGLLLSNPVSILLYPCMPYFKVFGRYMCRKSEAWQHQQYTEYNRVKSAPSFLFLPLIFPIEKHGHFSGDTPSFTIIHPRTACGGLIGTISREQIQRSY